MWGRSDSWAVFFLVSLGIGIVSTIAMFVIMNNNGESSSIITALIIAVVSFGVATISWKIANKHEKAENDYMQRIETEHRQSPEYLQNIEYCEEYSAWVSQKTKNVFNSLSNAGFNATWGFETLPYYNYQQGEGGFKSGSNYIFDFRELNVLYFDENSKKMLYAKCKGGFYKTFKSYEDSIFEYEIIPYSEIINVKLNLDSITTFQSTSKSEGVLGRSIIGGMIAGDAGAITGGATANKVTETKTFNKTKKLNLLCKQSIKNIR